MAAGNKMDIWFFPGWYPDRLDSMYGLFVRRHAEAVSLAHNVTVLYASGNGDIKSGFEITSDATNGINEIICYYHRSKGLFSSVLNPLRYLTAQIKLLRYGMKNFGSPDLCHVHVLTRAAIIPLCLSYFKGIPYVITEHWSRYLPENIKKGSYSGKIRRWFTSLVVRKSHGITAVTENLAGAMKNAGLKNENYMIVPNVADPELFKPMYMNSAAKHKGPYKLVHVSCFDEKAKNVKGIIDAISELRKERNDFKLFIVGDGEDHDMILEHYHSLSIPEDTIEFTGLLEGQPLAQIMATADLFVMFSNYENLPCTIVESLTCGVPVISTDVGGIREFVNDENGILVTRGNIGELTDGIRRVLDERTVFDRAKISQAATDTFSYEAVSEQFKVLYLAALKK